MQNYSKILAAVDFSEQSARIIDRARQLARQNDARLTVLHVVDYLPPVDVDAILPPIEDVQSQLEEAASARLHDLLRALPHDGLVERVVSGLPRQEILRLAEKEGIELIVLGSHGRRGLGRLLGSTTDGVLHRASCDVLVVR
ncbi:universal stress protein [Thiohalobacter sp. IOR34]|uniref:universal stress protein n=1 Tax=Thiohalobacter sp. IOR34 TaxID=3057176 RepID=UPI0025AFC53C|nr:universal stress protein [Thiohalobacter sp. IOR34]WJW76340.1 universal stress protein [Thiohalobacter sp. IOR34]